MKNPWNNMISLLPLQGFMSLTTIQGKLHASIPYSIFYVDFLHVAWILHQVLPKLLHPLICIKLMVVVTPNIPQVSPPLIMILVSALSVTSFSVAMGRSPT
ncbi:hypothetical protein BHM03_00038389 [Ensete ventricosum]|nr:hypothetical protein BHM03_00038389 [Ensete ventricosum]